MRKLNEFLKAAPIFCTLALAACTDSTLAPPLPPRDAIAPRLEVTSPARGTIQPGEAESIEVSGVVGDDSRYARVSVNGQPATVQRDGTFAVTVPVHDGITFLHTVATDAAGNFANDTRAVLSGKLVPSETPVANGIVVRLDAAAIRAGGELLAQRLAGEDLAGDVTRQNPLFENPIPCVSARADLRSLAHGAVTLQVTPIEGGLRVDAAVRDVKVALGVWHSTSCSSKGYGEATASAASFQLHGLLRLGVDGDGLVAVDRSGADAWLDGFQVDDGGGLPRGVLDQVAEPVSTALARVVADRLAGHVPSVILRGLGASDRVVPFGGSDLRVALRPTLLWIDTSGARVEVDTRVSLPPGSAGGLYLATGGALPQLASMASASSLMLGISEGAVNQLVSALWSAGAFDANLTAAAGLLPAGVTPSFDAVELSPRLPPVLTALSGGIGFRVAVGDVETAFLENVPGGQPRTVARLAVSMELTVSVSVSGGELHLVPVEQKVYVDPLRDGVADDRAFAGDSVERAGSYVAERVLGLLRDRVAVLPLPASPTAMSVAGTLYGATPVEGYVVMRSGTP